jgi:hypothetical protein
MPGQVLRNLSGGFEFSFRHNDGVPLVGWVVSTVVRMRVDCKKLNSLAYGVGRKEMLLQARSL